MMLLNALKLLFLVVLEKGGGEKTVMCEHLKQTKRPSLEGHVEF